VFLQAFTIIRPASILQLKDCDRRIVTFNLLPKEETTVANLTDEYQRAIKRRDRKAEIDSVMAMMASLHPMLGEAAKRKHLTLNDTSEGPAKGLHDALREEGGEDRLSWLAEVHSRKELIRESGRLTTLIRLYYSREDANYKRRRRFELATSLYSSHH
jgi:hypothetical protein